MPSVAYASGGYSGIVTELQFRPTPGVNYQPGTGTATASSYVPPLSASFAFDGNTSTYWEENNSPPFWLAYQYTSPITPKQIYSYGLSGYRPVSFDVQYSLDGGSTWKTLKSFPSVTYTNTIFRATIQ